MQAYFVFTMIYAKTELKKRDLNENREILKIYKNEQCNGTKGYNIQNVKARTTISCLFSKETKVYNMWIYC